MDWINLFLKHMTKGSIKKFMSVAFIQSYAKLIKWLIGKGKYNEEDLKLTLPLLERIMPNLS